MTPPKMPKQDEFKHSCRGTCSGWDNGYALGQAAMAERVRELEAKCGRYRRELEFYAKHHHHLNTTAPNFARQALEEGGGE